MKELVIEARAENLDEVLAFVDEELEKHECGMKSMDDVTYDYKDGKNILTIKKEI